jgi:drug/metabolite transporter (DMT)-like permease
MQDCDVNLETIPVAEVDQVSEAKPEASSTTLKVVLAYLVCGLTWGTTWYAIRVCVSPGGYSPFLAAAIRFTLAAVLFAVTCFIYRRTLNKPSRSELIWISFCGLLSSMGYLLLYVAERTVSGGLCAVLSATSPLIAALLAAFTGVERLSKTVVAGSVIAFSGVLLVFLDRLQVSPAQASAACLVILMCVFGASSNTGLKRHAHHVPALVTTTIFFSAISIVLWIGAALAGECTMPNPLPLLPTIALLHLTIPGTFITFICYFYFLKHVRLSTAMSLSFVTPIVALIVDGFLEKQTVLSLTSYAGIATVLVGVGLCMFVQFSNEKRGPNEVAAAILKKQEAA